ncbi:MAG: hypothetical protein WBP22_01090 [Candidatus Saccharimonas sp.]
MGEIDIVERPLALVFEVDGSIVGVVVHAVLPTRLLSRVGLSERFQRAINY